jgi:hypothetical protein
MGAEGTIVCSFDAKKSRNCCLIPAEVMLILLIYGVFDANIIFAYHVY